MKVYHGSNVVVSTPDVDHSRAKIDFGRGIRNTLFLTESVSL